MNNYLVLFFNMDNVVVLFRHSAEAKFKAFCAALLASYEMRECGDFNWFLNIQVIRDCSQLKLSLCQDTYISEILSSFHLEALTQYPDTWLGTEEL
jgi:hypothetical protein